MRWTFFFVMAGALLLSSCSSGATNDGSPSVREPLDMTKFQAVPCGLLLDEQIRAAGLNDPQVITPESECDRYDPVSQRSVTLGISNPTNGLSAETIAEMHENRKNVPQSYAYFVPSSVDGYPAIFASSIDRRGGGECEITVGVADDASFSVEFSVNGAASGGGQVDACPEAQRIAGMVVRNLKTGRI
ncbi:DUF3558 domain-containing protein [Saccharopolyspora sp. 5N708]|uniref:DUF3558 domain-containing protein n=1 Tax=Saccharopolyspora sp. 5N708 TaxID=3457424 RepID=UPI003FD06C77